MSGRSAPSPRALALIGLGAAALLAGAVAFAGSLLVAIGFGLLLAAATLWVAVRQPLPTDRGRRRFLVGMGTAGLGMVAAGTATGRALEGILRRDPRPALESMARAVGTEGMRYLKLGTHPDRSGDLQLVLAPFNTSNYPQESLALSPRDARSSHALLWGYAERVPVVIYAPGIVDGPARFEDRFTLTDLAPSTARLMEFDFPAPDGTVLPGLAGPLRKPRVVVTFVIDGGGWNVLSHWPQAWPNLRELMRIGLSYPNTVVGSFPSVTASAHATIGTGAFPRTHGITGHNMRRDGKLTKAWGEEGHADPSYLLSPTLAEAWSEETGDRAWIGEIGYQIWHLGMIGRGGNMPLGRPVVAMYWDEDVTDRWQPQNPDLYRMPDGVPPREELSAKLRAYFHPKEAAEIDRAGGKKVCCSPPIVRYQGDVIAAAFDQEPIGEDDVTALLYINYKSPDYTGHVYNMLAPEERIALEAVDRELGRLRTILEKRFPGEFALIVTADHGQCPLPDVAGGVRLDPIQLEDDINHAFARSVWPLVEAVFPSEVYLNAKSLWDSGVTREDIAAHLVDYRYGENIGPYVRPGAIEESRQDRREFAGVFPVPYLLGLDDAAVSALGSGRYPQADPGLPPFAS